MDNLQVIRSTDLGDTLTVVDSKLESNVSTLNELLREDSVAKGVFLNDWKQMDAASKVYEFVGEICSQTVVTEPTYAELNAAFDAALAANPNMNRYIMQYGSSSWGWTKYPDGRWLPGTHHEQSGANGSVSPQAIVVNDEANPLFVDRNGNPVDLSKNVSTFNLQPPVYMRMVVGASATWEVHKPVSLRSLELVVDAKISGYAFGQLKAEVTYEDGTVKNVDVRPYTSGYYFGDVIPQSEYVKKVKISVDAVTLKQVGKFPTHYAFDFATKSYIHRTDPAYASATPIVVVNYIYGYYRRNIPNFYRINDTTSITGEFKVTSNIAALAGTSVDNLLDDDPTTAYQSSTTANSLVLTLDKIPGTPQRCVFLVELTFAPLTAGDANDPVMNSISRVVVTTGVANASAVNTSNTRDLTGLQPTLDVNGNSYLALHAASPNMYPDIVDRIVITITKTVAGNFRLTGIKVTGQSPISA